MQRVGDDDLGSCMDAGLFIRKLEAALIEYAERYGPIGRSRAVLIEIEKVPMQSGVKS